MLELRTRDTDPSRDGVATAPRRAVVASGVTFVTTGCLGFGGSSEDTTDSETLPVVVTNRMTKSVLGNVIGKGTEERPVTVRVVVAEIDSETLKQTQVFEREVNLRFGQNKRWEEALRPKQSADEYVLKAELQPDITETDGPFAQDLLRFEPQEIPTKVGNELDVWLGGVSNGVGANAPGIVVERQST